MASLLLSRRDLDFLLYEWLDVELLTKRPRYAEHSRETFDSVLDLSEQMATKHFKPHNKKSDSNEPTFDGTTVHLIPEIKQALDVFAQSGLIASAMDESIGGMQLPHVVAGACFAWFQAANVGTSSYPFLTIGNANLLQKYGAPEIVEAYVRPMVEGRFFGTMCLSEPQAGSSLSDVTTRAEPQDDGTYRLFGNKMWISAGEHELSDNIVHLVLAKIPGGPAGVKGISLFVVPKVVVLHHESDDVAAFPATEAGKEAQGGVDVERRGLLVVEGAEPLEPAAAGAAQLDALPDDVGDRGALAHLDHVFVADAPGHPTS